VAPIPMPLPKHGKRRRRRENRMTASYSFLAKRCMPAGIWAWSRRRWPAYERRLRRSSPPANRRLRATLPPLLGMTHSRPAGYFHFGGQCKSCKLEEDAIGSHDFHFESASRSPRLSCVSGRIKLFGASRALAILTAIGRISRPSACPLDGSSKRVHRYPAPARRLAFQPHSEK
jgi:hypothetical protein